MEGRIFGTTSTPVVENINPVLRKYAVRWDFVKETEETDEVTFLEKIFSPLPSQSEIKDAIVGHYNKLIDHAILTTYSWKGKTVWLSTENQFNYKAINDQLFQLSVLESSNGLPEGALTNEILPITVKLNEDEKGNAIYHTFETVREVAEFCGGILKHIQTCLDEGWKIKDSINWDDYVIKEERPEGDD